MISAFARDANGIAGADAFTPEEMKIALEIVVSAEFVAAGKFLPTCPQSATDL